MSDIEKILKLVKSSPEALKEGIKDIDLRTLDKNSIDKILKKVDSLPKSTSDDLDKIFEKIYILIDNPKGGISINSKVNNHFLIEYCTSVNSPEKLKYLIDKYSLNYNVATLDKGKERLGIRLICLSIENYTDKITKLLLGYIPAAFLSKKEMGLILQTLYFVDEGEDNAFDNIQFYNLFIDNGININVPINETSGYNTLMYSIYDSNKKIFDFLIGNNHRARTDVNYVATNIAKNKYAALNLAITDNDIYYAKKLLELGANADYITPKIIMQDNKVFENVSVLQEVIYEKYNIEYVKLLLEYEADKSHKETTTNKTALDIAKDKYSSDKKYYREVIKLLGGKIDTELWKGFSWKGFSRSDIQKFDIFFENPFDWSCCPICLEYIERSAACMYMSHNCATTGHYYHEKLYDAYVYNYGKNKVEWCTVCGRITELHKHCILTDANNPSKRKAPLRPEVQAQLDRGDNVAFFDNANCIGFGGGGTEEKAARFRRLREYALELQEDVGKKQLDEAMEELIEEVWNAPLIRNRKVKKILEDKKWNINVSAFPEDKKNTRSNNNSNAANVPFGGRKPTVKEGGDCIIYADDEEGEASNPTYQFHHETVGGMDHDGIYICQKDLAKAVQLKCKEFGLEDFGKCWFSQCKGILHPEELKGIIPEVLYEEYRKKFNKKMIKKGGGRRCTRKTKKQRGGDVKSVLHELEDGTCTPHNWTKDGKLRK
jgi:hypothetical protein